MKHMTRPQDQLPRPKHARRKPLTIVLVYDGFTDLIRAYHIWAKLVARFRKEIQIVSSAWNFAMLRDPRFCEEAARRTADADMIVLSTGGRAALPDHIRNWISAWLPWKKGRRDALVAVLDEQSRSSAAAAELRDHLLQTAQQSGMDFFCNTDHGSLRMESAATG
jgi:hypothetical protein